MALVSPPASSANARATMRANKGKNTKPELSIIGVNTYVDESSAVMASDDFDVDVTRSVEAQRRVVIERNRAFKETLPAEAEVEQAKLNQVAREGGNLFEVMMKIVEHCTVGQVTQALFETSGKFRRNK